MSATVRRSPLAAPHLALGASMSQEAGWELPATYGDEVAEQQCIRVSVGLADVTARGKVDVHGELADPLAAAGDALVARISEEWALALGGPGEEEILLPKMTTAAGPASMVTDATHLFAAFALAGPGTERVVSLLSSWDPASLAPGAATGAPIADVRAVVVRRDLEVPVLEIYVATEFARYVWESVVDAVSRADGGPVGWRALRAQGWS